MGKLAEASVINSVPDGSRLARVVIRMADETVELPKSRKVRQGDPDRLMVTVLREIDESVLPRDIRVSTDNGDELHLLVSNRRLISVKASGASIPSDQASPGDPDEAARIYLDRLKSVLGSARKIELTHKRCPDLRDSDSVSCSAQSLARAAGLSVGILGGSPGLRDFLKSLESLATAWLYLPGKAAESQSNGDPALINGLSAFLDQTRPKENKAQIAARKPDCTVLPLPNGSLLISATTLGQHLLALVPESNLNAVITAWQKRF